MALETLERDGQFQGLRLPKAAVEEIRKFTNRSMCYGNADPALACEPGQVENAVDDRGQPIVIADYLESIKDCGAIRRLWEDRQLLEIAGGYLRTEPRLVRSRLWWSLPLRPAARKECNGGGTAAAVNPAIFGQNRYHFDLHDWRTLKFFFYLTDVHEGCGPHVFIRGSHRHHKLVDQFSLKRGFNASPLLDRYGAENVVKVTGDAGFGFVEDPFGFHTGLPVTKSPRLILEVTFGVSRHSPAGTHNAAI